MRVETELWEEAKVRGPATSEARLHEYIGALIEEERRLVLVPMDRRDPWAAFRRLRSWMRDTHRRGEVGLFRAERAIEGLAEVIPLAPRRACRS